MIIPCPECGKDVSDKAEMCPHCGYGVRAHFEEQKIVELQKVHTAEALIDREWRRSSHRRILYAALSVMLLIAAVAGAVAYNNFLLSNRMTFKTKDVMLEYLTGTYSGEVSSNGYFKFYENGFITLTTPYMSNGEYAKLSPQRGCFKFQNTWYCIAKNGKIYLKNATDDYNCWSKAQRQESCPADYLSLNNSYNTAHLDINLKDLNRLELSNFGRYDFAELKIKIHALGFGNETCEVCEYTVADTTLDKDNRFNSGATVEYEIDTEKIPFDYVVDYNLEIISYVAYDLD